MSTINETYINALLADAAYVRLHSGTEIDGPNTALLTGSALTTAIAARLTQPQADFITSNFEVLNQELSAFGGFDAVVWRGKVGTPYAGKVYVSMRGTQGLQDIADDGSLAFAGIPHQQIADMVNWWLRATASSSNTNVVQIKLKPPTTPLDTITFERAAPATGTGNLTGANASISATDVVNAMYLIAGRACYSGVVAIFESENNHHTVQKRRSPLHMNDAVWRLAA
jgi:hypothetical protein